MKFNTGDVLQHDGHARVVLGTDPLTVAPRNVYGDAIESRSYVLTDEDRENGLVHEGENAYIRFGDIPEDGHSYDSRNDREEAGVSVYACDVEDGVYHPKGTMIQTIFALMTRDTYLVTGEEVGAGADGEPVLRDVEIVTQVVSPEGVGGWVPA